LSTETDHRFSRPVRTNIFNRAFGLFLERISTINALIYLDNKTRYSGRKMGFVSALIVPMLTILMMYVIIVLIRHKQPGDMPIEVFLLTGMTIWLTFQHSMNSFIDLMRKSPSPMKYHHVVVSFDVTITRLFIALSPLWIVVVILVLGCVFMDVDIFFKNMPLTLLSLVGAILMGSAIGCIFGVLSLYAEIVISVKTVLNRVLFLTSGIFFSIDELPQSVYAYVKFIPLVHLIEGLRFSLSHTYPAATMQLRLAFEIIAVMLLFAILFNSIRRRYKES